MSSYRPFTKFGKKVMAIIQAGEAQGDGRSEAFMREKLAEVLYRTDTPPLLPPLPVRAPRTAVADALQQAAEEMTLRESMPRAGQVEDYE